MAGFGDVPADILFVGEAPGRLGADKSGVPFTVDRSGILFRRILGNLLEAIGCPLRVYVTNAVKCLPLSTSGLNRPPSPEETANCRGYLLKELALVRPKVVVPMGRVASRLLLGTDAIVWWQPIPRTPVIYPAKHPAYVVRGGGRERLTEAQYQALLAPAFSMAAGL